MRLLSKFFNLFRGHNWELIGITSTDPLPISELNREMSDALFERLVMGTTTYMWQCKKTLDIRKDVQLGTEESPLQQVLSRTDTYGKYEINNKGERYVVVKIKDNPVLPIVPQTISDLPIRNSAI